MNTYELTLVLPERATPAKKKAVIELISKLVKLSKGELKKVDDWGKIELSYPIAKNTAGNFLFFVLELDGPSAKSLEQKVRLEEGIIRHLLIRKEGLKE